jgi:uridine kinase
LNDLKRGLKVEVPVYDFASHSRLSDTTSISGAKVIIFEGIFALYDSRVRDMMDLKLFVDTDADIRLSRRLRRDIAERGRDVLGVLQQYAKFVKPSFDEFIYPTVRYADMIIPRGLENIVAIEVITKHIQRRLDDHEKSLPLEFASNSTIYHPNVVLLKQTKRLLHLHTIIQDKSISHYEFLFHTEQLARLLVEEGLDLLPFEDQIVVTPLGKSFKGKQLKSVKICGISVVRGGVSLEQGLRKVIKDIPIGKIFLFESGSQESMLEYFKLPDNVSSCYTLVMEDQITTGDSALTAIRVLLEHNVPQEQIIFLSLISSHCGLVNIYNSFPKVRVVTSAIEQYGIKDAPYI